jgi:hypothetical protein
VSSVDACSDATRSACDRRAEHGRPVTLTAMTEGVRPDDAGDPGRAAMTGSDPLFGRRVRGLVLGLALGEVTASVAPTVSSRPLDRCGRVSTRSWRRSRSRVDPGGDARPPQGHMPCTVGRLARLLPVGGAAGHRGRGAAAPCLT